MRRAKKYMIQKSFDVPYHDETIYQINYVLNGYIVNVDGDIEYYYNISLEKYVNCWNKPYITMLRYKQKYNCESIIPVIVKKGMDAITDEKYLCFINDVMYSYCLSIPIIMEPGIWDLDIENATISLSKIKLL